MKHFAAAAVSAIILTATGASAHSTLAEKDVTQGAASRLTLRIPHGCGAEATLRVRIQIPAGMVSVKPMPKANWKLDITSGPYDASYMLNGAEISEGVRELKWTGELPDAHYDEFVFQATVSEHIEPGTKLYIPAVQECATGSERWIEIPAEGEEGHDLARPAPGVMVMPAGAHRH